MIYRDTIIGDNVRIDEHTSLGKRPMKSALSALTVDKPLLPTRIASGVIIGTSVVIYRGSNIGQDTLVADLATIGEEVTIGTLSIIGRGVAIENRTTIGARCKIETFAYICGLSTIGDDCFIAPEVTFTNDNFLGRTKERFKYYKGVTMLKGARIGANATILPGVVIGTDALVAAGSIVTRNVPDRMIVLGQPGRPLTPVPSEQLLENQ